MAGFLRRPKRELVWPSFLVAAPVVTQCDWCAEYIWLAGTDVEAAMLRVQELEAESAKLKKQLAEAKKAVARSMTD